LKIPFVFSNRAAGKSSAYCPPTVFIRRRRSQAETYGTLELIRYRIEPGDHAKVVFAGLSVFVGLKAGIDIPS
jgi:hypothetical protein